MIFVSSSCVKARKIKDCISTLVNAGFKNIELSGGTEYYHTLEQDLYELKEKYQLNFICHNYFPPPKIPFVLNLSSMDDKIFYNTLEHFKRSIMFSKLLGSTKFGFHAGFFINVQVDDFGKEIPFVRLFDRKTALSRFFIGFKQLKKTAKEIELYIENNVLSHINYYNFHKQNPFFLTDISDYVEFTENINFKILLDIAHLKVSCNTLGLDFEHQLVQLIDETDYIHLSDNDGLSDTNNSLKKDGHLYNVLKNLSLENKIITLEIYRDLEEIRESHNLIEHLI